MNEREETFSGVSGGDVLSGTSDTVAVPVSSGDSQNFGGSPADIVSGGDNHTFDEGVNENDENIFQYFETERGGVPVVVVADNTSISYAVGNNNGYQLPTYYVDYFAGVLENLGDTEYLAFCTREYSSSSSYVEHYRLVYDLEIIDNAAQNGTYPCIDIYRASSSTGYTLNHTTYSLTSYPNFSYGSFGNTSDLRKGVGHVEAYAILFFLAFFTLYAVLSGLFGGVLGLFRKR